MPGRILNFPPIIRRKRIICGDIESSDPKEEEEARAKKTQALVLAVLEDVAVPDREEQDRAVFVYTAARSYLTGLISAEQLGLVLSELDCPFPPAS